MTYTFPKFPLVASLPSTTQISLHCTDGHISPIGLVSLSISDHPQEICFSLPNQPWLHCCFLLYSIPRNNAIVYQGLLRPCSLFYRYPLHPSCKISVNAFLLISKPSPTYPAAVLPTPCVLWFSPLLCLLNHWSGRWALQHFSSLRFPSAPNVTPKQHTLKHKECSFHTSTDLRQITRFALFFFFHMATPRIFLSRYSKATTEFCTYSQSED